MPCRWGPAAQVGPLRRLTRDPAWDSWAPRLSPDRRWILVHRTPAGTHDSDHRTTSIWKMAADGSGLTLLRPAGADGWALQGHAEWSPSGAELVLFGGDLHSPRIWTVLPAPGAAPTPVTAPGGADLDPSWLPDGQRIVYVSCPTTSCVPTAQEVYLVDRSGGTPIRLTTDGLRDQDPVVAPDGTRVAWLTNVEGFVWDIRVADIDGGGVRRLLGDRSMTSRPEWTRAGDGLVFHRFVPGTAGGVGLWRAASDGSGLTPLTPAMTGTEEYPST